MTSPLPRECSTTELHGRSLIAGAGEGNRTLVVSLEGFCSTIELHPPLALPHPPVCLPCATAIAAEIAGGGGWIRTNVGARPTDLQSAPFSRSGTPPRNSRLSTKSGGSGKQNRGFWAVPGRPRGAPGAPRFRPGMVPLGLQAGRRGRPARPGSACGSSPSSPSACPRRSRGRPCRGVGQLGEVLLRHVAGQVGVPFGVDDEGRHPDQGRVVERLLGRPELRAVRDDAIARAASLGGSLWSVAKVASSHASYQPGGMSAAFLSAATPVSQRSFAAALVTVR